MVVGIFWTGRDTTILSLPLVGIGEAESSASVGDHGIANTQFSTLCTPKKTPA